MILRFENGLGCDLNHLSDIPAGMEEHIQRNRRRQPRRFQQRAWRCVADALKIGSAHMGKWMIDGLGESRLQGPSFPLTQAETAASKLFNLPPHDLHKCVVARGSAPECTEYGSHGSRCRHRHNEFYNCPPAFTSPPINGTWPAWRLVRDWAGDRAVWGVMRSVPATGPPEPWSAAICGCGYGPCS